MRSYSTNPTPPKIYSTTYCYPPIYLSLPTGFRNNLGALNSHVPTSTVLFIDFYPRFEEVLHESSSKTRINSSDYLWLFSYYSSSFLVFSWTYREKKRKNIQVYSSLSLHGNSSTPRPTPTWTSLPADASSRPWPEANPCAPVTHARHAATPRTITSIVDSAESSPSARRRWGTCAWAAACSVVVMCWWSVFRDKKKIKWARDVQ